MAPHKAYLSTPLLCVIEAKRDDFDKGRGQCLAEMHACVWKNRRDGRNPELFGIVSNGQGWRFYRLAAEGDAWESELYAARPLPDLLGALDFICGECSRNVPVT